MITTVTVSVQAAAYDTQNDVKLHIYANEEAELEDRKRMFGVENLIELSQQIDLMNEGESSIHNLTNAEGRFNLLSVVDVPDGMAKRYVLYDIYEVIDGFETVLTELTEAETFCPRSIALENSRSYEKGIEGHSDALKDGCWCERTKTLEDGNNLIIIKNARGITPQQAVVFKLARSF